MSFTAGPWHTDLTISSPAGRVAIEPDIAIVYVQPSRYDETVSKQRLANARLIAAAPDLLAACQAAFKELNEIRARDGVPRTYEGRKSDVDPEYFSSVVDGLARAIAKATKGAGA